MTQEELEVGLAAAIRHLVECGDAMGLGRALGSGFAEAFGEVVAREHRLRLEAEARAEKSERQLAHDTEEWDRAHRREWEKNTTLAAEVAALRAERDRLREALGAAASSLEWIANDGRHERETIPAYAHSRATVARAALAAGKEPHA